MIISALRYINFLRKRKGNAAWDYIVFIIIAVLVLVLLLWMIMKSNSGLNDSSSRLGDLLT